MVRQWRPFWAILLVLVIALISSIAYLVMTRDDFAAELGDIVGAIKMNVSDREKPQPESQTANTVKGKGYRDISPDDAWQRIQRGENAILLDVRTAEENSEIRIPGSILIPLATPDAMADAARRLIPDKTTELFIYCRSGRRSVNAAKIFSRLGYENVYNLGGIKSWPFATESL